MGLQCESQSKTRLNGRWPLLGDSRIKLISKGATMCDCVSYDNGLCRYYEVEVKDLTHGCRCKGYNNKECLQASETLHVVSRSLASPLAIDER